MKKLSILILTNNRRPTAFKRALQSALEVEYRAEIIVLNNGREMDTSSFHRKIRYYHEEGLSLTESYARLVELAKGRYSMFLNDDDCLFPDMIKYVCDEIKTDIGLMNASIINRVEGGMRLLDIWEARKFRSKEFLKTMHSYDKRGDLKPGMMIFKSHLAKKIGFPKSDLINVGEYLLYRLLCISKRVQTFSLTGYLIGIGGDNLFWNNKDNLIKSGYQHIQESYPYVKEKYPDIAEEWLKRATDIHRKKLFLE